MPTTISGQTNGALHTIFGIARDDVMKGAFIWRQAMKHKRTVPGGQSYTFASHVERGRGVRFDSAGQVYSDTGDETYVQGTVTPKSYLVRWAFDAEWLNQAKSAGAFVKDAMTYLQHRKDFAIVHANDISMGDGTGVINKTEGAATASTVICEYQGAATSVLGGRGAPSFQEGLGVWIGTTAQLTTPPAAGAEYAVITDVKDSKTFNIDRSITYADGDSIVVGESGGRHEYNNVPNGVQSFVATSGTLQGISMTTYHRWRGFQLGNSGTGRLPTVTLLRQLQSGVAGRLSREADEGQQFPLDILLMHPDTYNVLANTASSAFRYNQPADGKATKQNIGTSGISFDQADVELSVYNRADYIYGWVDDPDALVWLEWGDWKDRVPTMRFLPYGDANQVSVDQFIQGNLATFCPLMWGAITDLNPSITNYWN